MRKLIAVLFGIIAVYSCEDIISVPDITEDSIVLLAPADDAVLDNVEVTFTWEETDFVDQYQIQVASPTFDEASQIVLDTIVGDSLATLRSVTRSFLPDTYQWRVRGLNSNFQTLYTTRNFTIDTLGQEGDIDLSMSMVTTIAPTDGATITESEINFNWEALEDATSYTVQIAFPNFENPVQVVRDTTLIGVSYSTALASNTYEWRIKAMNDTSQTPYTTHEFSVVNPLDISGESVVLIAPTSGTVIENTTVSFSWEAVTNATSYELQIATPDFENAIQIPVDMTFDTATTQSFDLEDGPYEWRVRARNAISETDATISDFSVDAIEDLSDQEVVITAPADGFETTETMVALSWEALEQATLYRVIITDLADNSTFLEQTSTETSMTVDFVPGMYTWAVRAENETQNTPFTLQTITILE